MAKTLTSKEKIDIIRLYRSQNVGPITFKALMARFGSASEAVKQLPDLARRGGRNTKLKMYSHENAQKELRDVEACGGDSVYFSSQDFPPALRHIPDPPPFLHIKGDRHLLTKECVAIVGSRNASSHNMQIAAKLAKSLTEAGYTVVSGMARGIDRAAHLGSLESGNAIAIIASGIDIVYPKENQDIYDRLCTIGCVVSEFAPGDKPIPQNFPRRNRIVSGIALGTVVIEATKNSGSLITARHALEQGRELFAVPGSPADKRSEGTNNLIREGAHITTNRHDVLNVLKSLHRFQEESTDFIRNDIFTPPDETLLDQCRKELASLISYDPLAVDQLIADTGFETPVVNTLLVELELAGRITRLRGNMVVLSHDNQKDF